MSAIVSEISHYAKYLEGKKIICPCDWDIVEGKEIYSIRIDFDEEGIHGHLNEVESVSLLFADEQNYFKEEKVKEEEIQDFLMDEIKCNFLRVLIQNGKKWKIKSVTASGFNPQKNKGIPFQEVDFSKYDVCITNPPFSQYPDFMKAINEAGIDLIALAPVTNRANPLSIGGALQERKLFLGFNRGISIPFINPTEENEYKQLKVLSDWVTTFRDAQNEIDKNEIKTGIKYEKYKEEYFEMENMTMKDGTHPIRVTAETVPDDYYGWMFGPLTLLTNLSYSKFEWYITNLKKYFNQTHPEQNPFSHKVSNEMRFANGKNLFNGIVFRRKK